MYQRRQISLNSPGFVVTTWPGTGNAFVGCGFHLPNHTGTDNIVSVARALVALNFPELNPPFPHRMPDYHRCERRVHNLVVADRGDFGRLLGIEAVCRMTGKCAVHLIITFTYPSRRARGSGDS